ncbi:MAG: 30S ribosomal protein S2, partial [Chitinophagaceae bacterium]
RDKDKMEKVLGGISQISRVPAALFMVDIGHEHIALSEAKRLNITTFGMVDTNCDPNKVDFAIPSNDDATKSIAIVVNYIAAAIAEGLQERQADKDDEDQGDTEESAEAKAARFESKADGGEDRGRRGAPGRGGSGAPAKRRVASAGPGGRRPGGGGR